MHDKTWHSAATAGIDAPSHTWDIFNVANFRRVVELFERKLVQIDKVHPFNAIAGCGNSGVPLAAALSYTMGIPLITVRKPGEVTVALSSQLVTGAIDAGSYVIIDDFSATAGTVNRMMDAIDEASGGVSTPVAIALYRQTVYGKVGAESLPWKKKDYRSIPMWGVTPAERDYIEKGVKEPTAQCDLFAWAEEKNKATKQAAKRSYKRVAALLAEAALIKAMNDEKLLVPSPSVAGCDLIE